MKFDSKLQLYRYGDTDRHTIDFLIYIPHGEMGTHWVDLIRQTSDRRDLPMSDDSLMSYIRHEADIGVREVAHEAMSYFSEKRRFSLAILDIEVPRAFCDLNRPPHMAIHPVVDETIWMSLYTETFASIENIVSSSDFVLQLHSMNNYDPIEDIRTDIAWGDAWVKRHLGEVYSGNPRECNLLSSDESGNILSDSLFDQILRDTFLENHIPLDENKAYQLDRSYPCNDIMQMTRSSFLEIKKWALARENMRDTIDMSRIELDQEKIQLFWAMLAHAMGQFLWENLQSDKKSI